MKINRFLVLYIESGEEEMECIESGETPRTVTK